MDAALTKALEDLRDAMHDGEMPRIGAKAQAVLDAWEASKPVMGTCWAFPHMTWAENPHEGREPHPQCNWQSWHPLPKEKTDGK